MRTCAALAVGLPTQWLGVRSGRGAGPPGPKDPGRTRDQARSTTMEPGLGGSNPSRNGSLGFGDEHREHTVFERGSGSPAHDGRRKAHVPSKARGELGEADAPSARWRPYRPRLREHVELAITNEDPDAISSQVPQRQTHAVLRSQIGHVEQGEEPVLWRRGVEGQPDHRASAVSSPFSAGGKEGRHG
jgi:hypothetical protein